jgi:hypothetical protein
LWKKPFDELLLLIRLLRPFFSTPSRQAQHQVEHAILLDVVVFESAAVLQLPAGEDEALMIRGNNTPKDPNLQQSDLGLACV